MADAGSSALGRIRGHNVRGTCPRGTGPTPSDRVGICCADDGVSDLDWYRVHQQRVRLNGAEHSPHPHQRLWGLSLADLERKDLAPSAGSLGGMTLFGV